MASSGKMEKLQKAIDALNGVIKSEKGEDSLDTILQSVVALEAKVNEMMKTGWGINGNPAIGSTYIGDQDLAEENDEKFPLREEEDIPKGLNNSAEEVDDELNGDTDGDENTKAEYMNDELTADQMEDPAARMESSSDFPANDSSTEIDYGNSGAIPLDNLQKLSVESKELREVIRKKNLNFKEQDGKLESSLYFNIIKKEIESPATGPTSEIPELYVPTPAQYKKINEVVSLQNFPPEKWRVVTGKAADQLVDLGHERFSQKAHDRMLDMAIKNKIPLLMEGAKDHEWAQKNVYGIVFDGDTKGGTLNYSIAIPVIEKTKNVLEAIMTGLYNKLSVGFALDPQNYICSGCNKSMFSMNCPHSPGMLDSKTGQTVHALIDDVAGNFEVSGVAVPMQPGAHIARQASKEFLIEKSIKNVDNDKIKNDSSTIEDGIMADKALENEEAVVKGDIDPVGHVPTPAETGPTNHMGIRTEKKIKLAKKIKQAAKNSKAATKALKNQTVALDNLVNAISGLKSVMEDTKKALDTRTGKSLEHFVAEAQPVHNTKSWIASYLGESDSVGGQE